MPDTRKRSPPSDDAEDVPKRKRRAYTRNACTFCQSRKVKCSGTQPCARCDELGEACTYAQSDGKDGAPDQPRKLDSSVQALVEHLSLLNGKMDNMLSQVTTRNNNAASSLGSLPERPRLGARKSSWSSIQSLRRAAAILTPRSLHSASTSSKTTPTLAILNEATPLPIAALSIAAEPIVNLSYDEAVLYLDLFIAEVLCMYPLMCHVDLRAKLDTLFETFQQQNSAPSRTHHLTSMDIEHLKVVLAIGASSREKDDSLLGQHLESYLLWHLESCFDQGDPGLDDIMMATLMTIYFLQLNEYGKAWRTVAVAARMSAELGLDDVTSSPRDDLNSVERTKRLVLVCCVADLDSRCALTVNLPRTMADHRLEGTLLPPTAAYAHIRALIDVDRILTDFVDRMRVRTEMSIGTDERPGRHDWHLRKTLELILKAYPFFPVAGQDPSAEYTIRSYMQIRIHHGRLVMHMPTLDSTQGDLSDVLEAKAAQNLIAAAKNVIGAYRFAIDSYRIIKQLRPTFDQFLLNAVSALYLASTLYATQYATLCGDSLRMGMEMLNALPNRPKGMEKIPLVDGVPIAENSEIPGALLAGYQDVHDIPHGAIEVEGLEAFDQQLPAHLSEWDWANVDMPLPDVELTALCEFDGGALPSLPMI